MKFWTSSTFVKAPGGTLFAGKLAIVTLSAVISRPRGMFCAATPTSAIGTAGVGSTVTSGVGGWPMFPGPSKINAATAARSITTPSRINVRLRRMESLLTRVGRCRCALDSSRALSPSTDHADNHQNENQDAGSGQAGGIRAGRRQTAAGLATAGILI